MKEEQPITETTIERLLGLVQEQHMQGKRLVQICCTRVGENGFELTYSFDIDYILAQLRVNVKRGEVVPSISGIYAGAFLYENEITELFGPEFRGMSVDYRGCLYKKKGKTPFDRPAERGGAK